MLGKYGSDGVYGFVPGQTARSETSHCPNDGFEIFGKLVLNDYMKDSVGRQIGQLDVGNAMVFFRKVDSFLFIEREPLFWVRCVVRVVMIHCIDLVRANKAVEKASFPHLAASSGLHQHSLSTLRWN